MIDSSDELAQREEQAYLATTMQAIALVLQQPPPDGTELAIAHLEAEAALARQFIAQWEDLQAATGEPYFGRVDFCQAIATEAQPIYIGRSGIRAPELGTILVHDWRAPISSLFYQRGFRQVRFTAPGGEKIGDVSLRRRYYFASGQLLRFVDERPATAIASPEHDGADGYLRELLQQTREVGLRDIIATIQSEQDALIRAPFEGVLIVQGVAGSGKTSIALHRLSYLLYTFPERLSQESVLVIGPNPVFLSSIAPLFPQLGIHAIAHMTFTQWARELLGEDMVANLSAEEPLERFLDRSHDQQTAQLAYQRLRLMASRRMVDLVEAYIVFLRRQYEASRPTIEVTYELPANTVSAGSALLYHLPGTIVTLTMPVSEVESAMRAVVGKESFQGLTPLQQYRDGVITRCLEWFWKHFQRTPAFAGALDEGVVRARETAFKPSVKSKLERHLRTWWPAMTPATFLTSLFGDADLLQPVAATLPAHKKPFTTAELALLHQSRFHESGITWTDMDLPLLCLARLFLLGRPERRTPYVVVDEAQDRSELELFLLRGDAVGMTLVGDLAQGVFAYRGVATWKHANAALGGQASVHQVQQSYRSTWEISQLGNRILQRGKFSQPMSPAQPFARHGPAPQIRACHSQSHLADEARHIVQEALASGKQSVAMIAKTSSDCRQIYAMFDAAFTEQVELLDVPDQAMTRKAVVLPVWLAKGLEFDVVVVVGADAASYSTREVDAKLLYVGVTRALHELTILHVGPVTALLREGM